MAFDFLGTFNRSQFERFMTFARSQLADVKGRIAHLTYEIDRVGTLTFEYDGGGTPTSYKVTGVVDSYIGGLVAAYEVLGGDTVHDLQVRTRSQSVFVQAGTEVTAPQFMSNGEVIGTKGLADGVSAEYMRQARTWMLGPLHYRREYLERKIRRALDYVEQMNDEIALLRTITQDAESRNSLEYVAAAINTLLDDPNYRSIFNDNGQDPHGRTTYAPFAIYSRSDSQLQSSEPGPASRDNDGYTYPGA